MMITRRKLIGGLGLLIAAPAVIRVAQLMPVKAFREPDIFNGWIDDFRIAKSFTTEGYFKKDDAENWHHLALTRDGGNTRAFLDGSSVELKDVDGSVVRAIIGQYDPAARLMLNDVRTSMGIARYTENL